jgi:hypothetical protein
MQESDPSNNIERAGNTALLDPSLRIGDQVTDGPERLFIGVGAEGEQWLGDVWQERGQQIDLIEERDFNPTGSIIIQVEGLDGPDELLLDNESGFMMSVHRKVTGQNSLRKLVGKDGGAIMAGNLEIGEEWADMGVVKAVTCIRSVTFNPDRGSLPLPEEGSVVEGVYTKIRENLTVLEQSQMSTKDSDPTDKPFDYLRSEILKYQTAEIKEIGQIAVDSSVDQISERKFSELAQNNIDLLRSHGEIGKVYADAYVHAVELEPELETVVFDIDTSDIDIKNGASPGSAIHPERTVDGKPHVRLNVARGLELYKDAFIYVRPSVEEIAKSLGKTIDEMTPEILASQVVSHELGHIVDYIKNAPTLKIAKERRREDMDSLPAPGFKGSLLRSETGQEYYAKRADYYAQKGIMSHAELVEAQQRAYRQVRTERFADEFANKVVQSMGIE